MPWHFCGCSKAAAEQLSTPLYGLKHLTAYIFYFYVWLYSVYVRIYIHVNLSLKCVFWCVILNNGFDGTSRRVDHHASPNQYNYTAPPTPTIWIARIHYITCMHYIQIFSNVVSDQSRFPGFDNFVYITKRGTRARMFRTQTLMMIAKINIVDERLATFKIICNHTQRDIL